MATGRTASAGFGGTEFDRYLPFPETGHTADDQFLLLSTMHAVTCPTASSFWRLVDMQGMQIRIAVAKIGQSRCPLKNKSLRIVAIEAELIFVFGKSDIQLISIASLEQEWLVSPMRIMTPPAFSVSYRLMQVVVFLKTVTERRVTPKAERFRLLDQHQTMTTSMGIMTTDAALLHRQVRNFRRNRPLHDSLVTVAAELVTGLGQHQLGRPTMGIVACRTAIQNSGMKILLRHQGRFVFVTGKTKSASRHRQKCLLRRRMNLMTVPAIPGGDRIMNKRPRLHTDVTLITETASRSGEQFLGLPLMRGVTTGAVILRNRTMHIGHSSRNVPMAANTELDTGYLQHSRIGTGVRIMTGQTVPFSSRHMGTCTGCRFTLMAAVAKLAPLGRKQHLLISGMGIMTSATAFSKSRMDHRLSGEEIIVAGETELSVFPGQHLRQI